MEVIFVLWYLTEQLDTSWLALFDVSLLLMLLAISKIRSEVIARLLTLCHTLTSGKFHSASSDTANSRMICRSTSTGKCSSMYILSTDLIENAFGYEGIAVNHAN